ncbi:MAG: hypothetical protein Tsb0014_05740 [Pleurocapsa sp.]
MKSIPFHSCPLTPEGKQQFQQLKAKVERAVSDGVIDRNEIRAINETIFSVKRNKELTFQELELVERMVWSQVRQGKLTFDDRFE